MGQRVIRVNAFDLVSNCDWLCENPSNLHTTFDPFLEYYNSLSHNIIEIVKYDPDAKIGVILQLIV